VRITVLGLIAWLTACAGTTGGIQDDAADFSKHRIVELYVTVREAERRRDPEYAEDALRYASSADRTLHHGDIAYLEGVQAGPVCAPSELHLVGIPASGGPGLYLVLEPVGLAYRATPFDVVRTSRGSRILYRPLLLTERETVEMPAEVRAAVAAQRLRNRWAALEGADLSREADRLRVLLRHEMRALEYARAAKPPLPLQPFSPPPNQLLSEIDGRSPEEIRDYVVALLDPTADN